MYFYEGKKYFSQKDLIQHLYEKCISSKHPMAKTASKSFDVLDSNGDWYVFYFKFDVNYQLVNFSCKKDIDIKGTSLRDCWKYVLEGIGGAKGAAKGFETNKEVAAYIQSTPDILYRLEIKEPNGSITTKGILYDSILKTLVIDRVPWKGKSNK